MTGAQTTPVEQTGAGAVCVGVMQPYFLPYLSYFALLRSVSHFVSLDSVQFIRRGWINRNRLPASNGDWWYFGIPIEHAPRDTPIDLIRIADAGRWRTKLRRSIFQKYGSSPYFPEVLPLLEPLWAPGQALASLLLELVKSFSAYLGIAPQWLSSRQLEERFPSLALLRGEERIIGICQKLGATRYLNPHGGRALYSAGRFALSGVELRFLPPLEEFPELEQRLGAGSILELVLRHPREVIIEALDTVASQAICAP